MYIKRENIEDIKVDNLLIYDKNLILCDMRKEIYITKNKIEIQSNLKRKDFLEYNINKLKKLIEIEEELYFKRTEKYQSSEKGEKELEEIESIKAYLSSLNF